MTADQSAWADAANEQPRMTRRELLAERADLHRDDLSQPVMAVDEWDTLPRDHPTKVNVAHHEHDTSSLGCRSCGERCDDCGDRMCDEFGPEPRACGTTCADCPCNCEGCLDVRADLAMELASEIERDARRTA